jgi:putative solute:sodium symporter small subunit
MDKPTPITRAEHWQRTRRLSMQLLLLWMVTGFGAAFFARELATLNLFGWPLSFYLAAQGSSLVYLGILAITPGACAPRQARAPRPAASAATLPPILPALPLRPAPRRSHAHEGRPHIPPAPALLSDVHGRLCLLPDRAGRWNRKACRASGSATCSCLPPSCCTPPSA